MNIQDIPSLQQTHRLDAQAKARQQVTKLVGKRPKIEDYQSDAGGKYPKSVIIGVVVLSIIVLAMAFILSAMRLYDIGHKSFLMSIPHAHSGIVAGVALIMLAEAASVLFTVAASVIGHSRTSRAILLLSTGGTAALALSGNYEVALKHHEMTLFLILEAMLPPMLTLSTAYVLKELLLETLETWQQSRLAFQNDLKVWEKSRQDATAHPRWMLLYANELRDMIKQTYARRKAIPELLASLDDAQWAWLIRREMASDDWFGYATQIEYKNQISMAIDGQVSPQLTELTSQKSQESPRQTPALDAALRHLQQYPGDINLTNRALGDAIGVSKDVAGKAKEIFIQQQQDEDTHETQAIDVPVLEQAGV